MENNNELGKDAIEMENEKEPVVVDVKLGVENGNPENFIKSENGDNQKETAVDNANMMK